MRPLRVALLSLAALATALVAVAVLLWVAARLAWVERGLADRLSRAIGVPVTIGDLAVGYFPTPSVEASRVALGPVPGAAAPTVTVAAARVELPWRTVLGRALHIDRLEVSEPALSLAVDAAGADNWTAIVDGLAALGGEEDGAAEWSIGTLELGGGTVDYRDAREGGAAAGLTGIALEAKDLAPRAAFPLRLRAAGQAGAYTFHAAFDGFARLDPEARAYAGEELTFKGWLGGGELGLGGVELAGSAKALSADLEAGALEARDVAFDGLGVQATGDFKVTSLDASPQVAFEMATEPFAPRAVANSLNAPLPATASPAALARAALRARGSWSAEAGLLLETLAGELDDSRFTGSASLPADGAPPRLRLEVDDIVLDGYLSPTQPEDQPVTLPEAAEALIAQLRELDVDAGITIGRAQAVGAVVHDLRVAVEPNPREAGRSEP